MITFLFWNINRSPLQELVAALAEEHRVDVLMLAECDIPAVDLLEILNRSPDAGFHAIVSLSKRIKLFTRFSNEAITVRRESGSFAVYRLTLPLRLDILLAVAHLPSKLRWDEDSLHEECVVLSQEIRDEETRTGHERTILVGDLNVNPFEKGVVGAAGLHGVMEKSTALRRTRTVQSRSYRFSTIPCGVIWEKGLTGRRGLTTTNGRLT